MAANLAAAGFLVTAWNRTPEKSYKLRQHGVGVARDARAACADCEMAVVMLSSGPVCREVLFGDDGVAAAMPRGALLVVMSSISVAEAEEFAARAAKLGLRWLDAPVSGGEAGAKAATLSIMVGGSQEDMETARPVFDILGRAVHIGPVGTGQLAKLVNQLTVASTIVAVSEALLLAEAGGADPAKVRKALLGGFARSHILEMHGQRMIEGDFAPGGPAKYQIEDTAAAQTLARDLGLRLPMLDLAHDLFSSLVDGGGGELDHSALILELRRQNGRLSDEEPTAIYK
jgi:2-hydroxy-3-oxopropionate reductase